MEKFIKIMLKIGACNMFSRDCTEIIKIEICCDVRIEVDTNFVAYAYDFF